MAGDRHGKHNTTTISFRVNSYEKATIEERVKVSGMKKQDYIVRSCIYNHVCVVGKKETVYQIVEKLQEMQSRMEELAEQIKNEKSEVTTEEIRELQTSYEDMLKAVLWMLDGAKYLWQGNTNGIEKSPDSGNC